MKQRPGIGLNWPVLAILTTAAWLLVFAAAVAWGQDSSSVATVPPPDPLVTLGEALAAAAGAGIAMLLAWLKRK